MSIIDDLWDDSAIDDWPESTPVRDYYKGKTIFLTGTTGSVGRLILQKLVRLDAGHIYVHIREKKGCSSLSRLQELCKDVTMNRAIKHNPNLISKITVIQGDLEIRNLGMSEQDIDKLQKNVEIVLAVAADVRFNQPLRQAVNSNVRSIYDLLKIAENMQKLESFIFMSTAYSNNALYGEEKFYQVPVEPEALFQFVHQHDECTDEINQILTQKIIAPWGNTYTYTKNIAEYLVLRYKHKLPVAIIRPSIIVATDRDPLPGWFGNLYALNGLIIGFGMGVLRIMFSNQDFVGDVIPGDYVANSTLTLAYFTQLDARENYKNLPSIDPIYNCVSSTDNPQTWNNFNNDQLAYLEYCCTIHMIWYPTSNFESNWTLFKLFNLIYHCLPAFFIDKYLERRGDKIRLMRIYRSIFHNVHAVSFFMKNWKFDSSRMRTIYDRMTAADHKVFPCDVRNVSWPDFNMQYAMGARVWWLKDSLKSLPAAKKKRFRLKVAHYVVRGLYLGFLSYVSFKVLELYGVRDYVQSFWMQ